MIHNFNPEYYAHVGNDPIETKLTHCDTEPLHEIGAIQDKGYVIAVSMESPEFTKITAISDNLTRASWMIEKDVNKILGRNLFELFDRSVSSNIASLLQRFQAIVAQDKDAFISARNFSLLKMISQGARITVSETLLCCSVVGCSNPNTYILELEELSMEDSLSVPNNQILQSGDIVGRIRAGDAPETVTASFCDAVMEVMTGYDRGMVYRFCDDFSGEVIHENIRDPSKVTSSYMGLRFPAGDIPVIARQLYMINGLRVVADADGVDSKILSLNNEPLDLTMSSLRGCSEMHLKYLHNMGVRSSMSIAIVVNDCLWGLYALHSYTAPTKPTVEQRIMLEMVGSISAMRVDFFERDRTSKRKLDLTQCMRHLHTTNSLTEFLNTHFRSIINILDAHAIVVYENSTDGGRMIFGDTSIAPTQSGLETLTSKAKSNSLYSLSNFSDGLEGLGAGVIFFKHATASLALIRRSRISDVKWGGTPDKVYDPKIPDRLTPRVSFATYLESSRKEAKLWTPVDLELADLFFERTTQYLHDQMLATFRLSLDQSNAECIQAIESAQEHYEFFAHMSHELRTPFHGVISSLQILNCDQVKEAERDDIIDSALDCGKSMLRTLDDILTIAKSRTCAEMSRSPVAVAKMVSSTKRMMVPMAENKSVMLSFEEGVSILEGHEDLMHLGEIKWPTLVVLADETRIGQVTNNLTSNAIKFTSAGGQVTIRVHISSQQDMIQSWKMSAGRFENAFVPTSAEGEGIENMPIKNDEPWYIYEVEDTGCGVSGEDMKVMFNAYKQVSSGVTKTYQGTGLGLHICRTHAALMNGVLGVASTRGKGTIFYFAIPVAIVTGEESLKAIADEAPAPPIQEKSAATEGGGFSMSADEISTLSVKDALFLIVDDSTVNLRLTKRKIQLALGDDIGIKTAVDGLEAIAFYEDMLKQGTNTNLTGIFMDYHMPRCSGLEAMEVIRRMEKEHGVTQGVHMIAFTADLSENTTQKLHEAGANDVMAKPTPTGEIENACAELIRKKQKMP